MNLQIDVPGFNKEDINILLEKGYLTVEAKKEKQEEIKDAHYLKRERVPWQLRKKFLCW
jgi:HSP20 family molecular chaperone IbpA